MKENTKSTELQQQKYTKSYTQVKSYTLRLSPRSPTLQNLILSLGTL